MYPALLTALTNPDCYPHPVAEIRVIETHISWVVLTGEIAYKIKKPVDFGFLNFTSLESRKHYCYEELRLNQRLAPDIYESVVGFTGSPEQPTFNGDGEPFEYAVQMRQFDESLRLDRLLANNVLTPEHIDALSQQIADFHLQVPHATADGPWGAPETIWQVVSDNFLHAGEHLDTLDDWMQLQQLSYQISQQFRALEQKIIQRKQEGHIRECHGDLHLANTTLLNDQVRLFDCIEFNLEFRWIDTICDLAFLLMDLEANHQPRLAHRCLNRYLEITGDYDGVQLLNLYQGYRAMVRAKVAMIGAERDLDEYHRYMQLALSYANKPAPVLFLMQGVSGSGKSFISQQLLERSSAIRIRSDIERKRLHREYSLQGNKLELYGHEMNVHTYNHLKALTERLLRVGESVIVDATFIRERTRSSYISMAEKLGIEIRIIACECDPAVMGQRLELRQLEGTDPSDADVTIMRQQRETQQHLSEQEQALAYRIDTSHDLGIEQLTRALHSDPMIALELCSPA
ncbi:MAG: AAA family ATPase [Amphritea sp.]|nr:AAA family ATPase [Amphritea sp.]